MEDLQSADKPEEALYLIVEGVRYEGLCCYFLLTYKSKTSAYTRVRT